MLTKVLSTPAPYSMVRRVPMSTNVLPPNAKAKVYDENGKTSIPSEVRRDLGITEGDTLQFVSDGESITVTKVED